MTTKRAPKKKAPTAKNKKAAPVRRKKNAPKKDSRKKILEYKGWKAGDRCYTVFAGETKPTLCDVIEFHPDDSVVPSASLMEVTSSKYRVAPVSVLSETAKGAKDLRPALESILAKAKKKKKQLKQKTGE